MNRNYVLTDIDHTLSDAVWRDHMITPTVNWDDYHRLSIKDQPIEETVHLVNALHAQGFYIFGITSRPAKWRKLTMDWMIQHRVAMDDILMRADDDYRRAPELKLHLAMERFRVPREEVAFLIEDREDVCSAFRAIGISTLLVAAR